MGDTAERNDRTAMDRLMSVKEAAGILGITPVFLYKLCSAREIEHVAIGKRILLTRSQIDRFVESRTVEAANRPGSSSVSR